MATIINNPSGEGSGIGIILGVILALAVIGIFFVYGLPAMRGNPAPADSSNGASINIELPTGNGDSETSGVDAY